jgi:hypothetical protein
MAHSRIPQKKKKEKKKGGLIVSSGSLAGDP